jgi:hypothetical protein
MLSVVDGVAQAVVMHLNQVVLVVAVVVILCQEMLDHQEHQVKEIQVAMD